MDLSPEMERYVAAHTSPESALLHRIHRETYLEVLKPRMLSGHVQGAALAAFSQMLRPRYVLEIGTYTGYSALCLAQGLQADGLLVTLDKNAELEQRVRGYFAQSVFGSQIDYRIGYAADIIPTLPHTFDLVFIDADKANYATYYTQVFEKVRPGGFFIADNVLWSGKIIDPNAHDKDTVALRDFNRMVQEDPRVENVILPIRDGLLLVRKLPETP